MILTESGRYFRSNIGTPEDECLMTKQSIFIEFITFTVSISDSPLLTLLACIESVAIVAPNRFSASSKEVLVRVEFSKKRLAMVLPLSIWDSGNGSEETK
jgi:hypothetical protein